MNNFEERESYASNSCYSVKKSIRQDKRHRRYRQIGMHRLKSTHLLTDDIIQSVF